MPPAISTITRASASHRSARSTPSAGIHEVCSLSAPPSATWSQWAAAHPAAAAGAAASSRNARGPSRRTSGAAQHAATTWTTINHSTHRELHT